MSQMDTAVLPGQAGPIPSLSSSLLPASTPPYAASVLLQLTIQLKNKTVGSCCRASG